MRISFWQLSSIALLSMLIGQNLSSRPHPANASSQDVFGSPQIAVTTYKNQKGNFTLWSDGHISNIDTPDKIVSNLSDCSNAPLPVITHNLNQPQGSPNVPVGIYQNHLASYILFADGSYKQPKGDAAAPGFSQAIRSAIIDGNTLTVKGDTSIKVATGMSPGYYLITFNPPFKQTPVVTVSTTSDPGMAGVINYSLATDRCTVWTGRFDKLSGSIQYENTEFNLIAAGD